MNWFDWAHAHLRKWMARQADSRALAEFTPRAVQVLVLARKEAERLKHDYIGTEHLLLGLVALDSGIASGILKRLGMNLEGVRLEVEKQGGIGLEESVGYIPFTPRAKRILAAAKKEASALGHTYVGTEHLLLALLKEREGLAAHVFKKFNIELEKARCETLEEITPIYGTPGNELKKAD